MDQDVILFQQQCLDALRHNYPLYYNNSAAALPLWLRLIPRY